MEKSAFKTKLVVEKRSMFKNLQRTKSFKVWIGAWTSVAVVGVGMSVGSGVYYALNNQVNVNNQVGGTDNQADGNKQTDQNEARIVRELYTQISSVNTSVSDKFLASEKALEIKNANESNNVATFSKIAKAKLPTLANPFSYRFVTVVGDDNTATINLWVVIQKKVAQARTVFYNVDGSTHTNPNAVGKQVTISGFAKRQSQQQDNKTNKLVLDHFNLNLKRAVRNEVSTSAIKNVTNVSVEIVNERTKQKLKTRNEVIEFFQALTHYNLIREFAEKITKKFEADSFYNNAVINYISFNPEKNFAENARFQDTINQTYSENGYNLILSGGGIGNLGSDQNNFTLVSSINGNSSNSGEVYYVHKFKDLKAIEKEFFHFLHKPLFTSFDRANQYHESLDKNNKFTPVVPDYKFDLGDDMFPEAFRNIKVVSREINGTKNLKLAIPGITTTKEMIYFLQAVVKYKQVNKFKNLVKNALTVEHAYGDPAINQNINWISFNPEKTGDESKTSWTGEQLVLGGRGYHHVLIIDKEESAATQNQIPPTINSNGENQSGKLASIDGQGDNKLPNRNVFAELNYLLSRAVITTFDPNNPFQNK